MGGDAEQQHPADTALEALFDLLTDPVRGIAVLALQGGDGLFDVFALNEEQGIDEALGGYPGLPHHAAQIVAGTEPAGTDGHFHYKRTSLIVSIRDSMVAS